VNLSVGAKTPAEVFQKTVIGEEAPAKEAIR
jgi:hypothetical protein